MFKNNNWYNSILRGCWAETNL